MNQLTVVMRISCVFWYAPNTQQIRMNTHEIRIYRSGCSRPGPPGPSARWARARLPGPGGSPGRQGSVLRCVYRFSSVLRCVYRDVRVPESGNVSILEGWRLPGRLSLISYTHAAFFGLAQGVLLWLRCRLCLKREERNVKVRKQSSLVHLKPTKRDPSGLDLLIDLLISRERKIPSNRRVACYGGELFFISQQFPNFLCIYWQRP